MRAGTDAGAAAVGSINLAGASEKRRGLLVPVANPEGVAPLLTLALAVTESEDPPPLVLGIAKVDDAPPPQPKPVTTPALSAALAYAERTHAAIQHQAIWSTNPPHDIVLAAEAARVAWVLLGYHRGALGADTMGGAVREVFNEARSLPLNVAAFVHGTDRPFERIYAAVDGSPDGRAALALAVRVARRNHAKLRALLVTNSVPHSDTDLIDMVSEAQASMGRLFHTDVLTHRSLDRLFKQTPGRLLIVGRKFADEVKMPLDAVPDGDRCVIVVQGAGDP